MKIRMGEKYWLNSDQYCYWITEEYTAEKGKGAGSIAERRVSGYTPTFEAAVDSFIEKTIGGAEISDLRTLAKMVNELNDEVRSWRVDLEKVR